MYVPTLRYLFAVGLALTLQVAAAQSADAGATQESSAAEATAAATAFSLQIEAPQEIRQLLEKHLDLLRYQVMADLSDAEIQGLVQAAEQNARELIATLGYFSPQIQIELLSAQPASGRTIRIAVDPGPETRVRDARLLLQGPILTDPQSRLQRQTILDSWNLPEHERFSQSAWEEAKQQSLKLLLSQRYAAASVQSSRADIDADNAAADLEVTLDSGPAYRIGRLEVEGTSRYSEDLVRNFARLIPGEDYTLSNLVDAQKRLTDSGYFDSAYLSLDVNSNPAQAVVKAQVKEAAMQKLALGIGASTDTGLRWSAEHTYNQVPVIGWRAVNKISIDRDTRTLTSDWTSQPSDTQWRWAVSGLLGQVIISEIEVNTQRYRLGRFSNQTALDRSYFLQYERTNVVYREIDEAIANEAASVNFAFALRRFDNIPFPTRGWGVGGEFGAGTILGSQQQPYARTLLQARLYQPLETEGAKLFNRQRSGRMLYRAQIGAVLVDDAGDVPFNQLFLTGGDTTVRGYKRDEIGVTRDGVLSADSGRFVANASAEWQRAIVRGGVMTDWEGALFVDTGAVANRIDELSFKVGVGVGARWKSPIGPLQLDLAYGVATQRYRLHLTAGFVF